MIDRHHRQTLLPQIGVEGQARLRTAHALIVGCGALGTVAADLLCRAGVGMITLIDRDIVELTNLQRQTLYTLRDAEEGWPKAEAAARRLREIDPAVRVSGVVRDVSARTAEAMLRACEACAPVGVIFDGTDNFEARFLLNDLAVKHGVPLVYCGAVGTSGMGMTVIPGRTPCLRCVFDEPPARGSPQRSATCDTIGVLGPATTAIASLQTAECLKILSGRADECLKVLRSIDVWTGAWRSMDLAKAQRAACPCCGERRFEFLESTAADDFITLCGRDAFQVSPRATGQGEIDLAEMARRLAPHGDFEVNRFLLRGRLRHDRDGDRPIELMVFRDGRVLILGSADVARARSLYVRYIES